MIGEIIDLGTDPTSEQPAYRVRLETDPSETDYVGSGVRLVDCASARAEMSEDNPEPIR